MMQSSLYARRSGRKNLSRRGSSPALFERLEDRVVLSQGPIPGDVIPQITGTAVSTVPANGDGNPYGVAFVPSGFPTGGPLHPGDLLVSNFNSSSGLQGTGTTIVRVDANVGSPGTELEFAL